jgi:hypothetical protein
VPNLLEQQGGRDLVQDVDVMALMALEERQPAVRRR